MKNKRLKEKIMKAVAMYIALNLIAEFIIPTAAFALTNGPSQPEVDSFEPVNTNQMVDLFSGDFNYNIPLFTVPGPNGGYPINLAYHAGISMEQEASWVGLGWNINPGAITRTMRGLPDDFSGEKVKKTFNIKPNITAGASMSSLTVPNNVELFGFEATMQKKTYQIRYNSYKGLGFSYNRSRSYAFDSKKSNSASYFAFKNLTGNFGIDFDSQNGLGVQPSISYENASVRNRSVRYTSFSAGFGFHSRNGISSLSFSFSRLRMTGMKTNTSLSSAQVDQIRATMSHPGRGAGVTFSAGNFVPRSTNSFGGFSASGFFKNGAAVAGTHYSKAKEVFFSMEGVLDKEQELAAYGFQYLGDRATAEDNALMDFNRQAEFSITPDAPSLPVPVLTNDVYCASAQGMGMVFRPYRSDIGVTYDPKSTSNFGSARIGNEPGGAHSGLNIAASYVRNYSGKWKDQWDDLEGDYEFKNWGGLSESFYFKATGEQVADDEAYGETARFGGENAVDFRIGMKFDGTLSWEPQVFNKVPHSNSDVLTYNGRNTRARRSQNIEYRSRAQITGDPDYAVRASHLFPKGDFPGDGTEYQYDFSSTFGGTINTAQNGEISVLNAEGNRYVYGIPAYNLKEKDAFFSVDKPGAFSRTILYSAADATVDNSLGGDHLFSSTEMPAYAYAYLLTAIYSPDYVDVSGNGPSDDDLGYYVKFNYWQDSTYKWRTPFTNADYDQGFHSNDYDDKASYRYGERENYFLNSIETKTHIAEFHTSNRRDGRGAYDELNESAWQPTVHGEFQNKLDEIKLFSKEDRAKPIKSVHFKYSYDLCPGVENNDGLADISSNVVGGNADVGKLTLKEVWFTYGDNQKGSLSPYKFYYREDDPVYNPAYNLLQMDCWGNYKPDELITPGTARNEEFPFVSQKIDEEEAVDNYMSAWNLHQITLPSGGVITVDYESDDYASVQDRDAMQMFEIAFTGKADDGTARFVGSGALGETGDDVRNRIYFELAEPVCTTGCDAEIYKYIEGIDNLYFRTYMKLPKSDNTGIYLHSSYDYVEGYCKIIPGECGIDDQSYVSGQGYTRGYVTVEPVSVSSMNLGAVTVHPFRKATWEYLRMHRQDLLYPAHSMEDMDLLSLNALETVISLFNDFSAMLLGYYNACLVKGFSKEMNLTAEHPSVIRLNTPDKAKNGGGHRVKQITINDEWDVLTGAEEDDFTYGQEYIYNKRDGSSYGVAEYEPLIGGAENPLHQPTDKFSSTRRMLINDKNFYLEYPLCESYYPGANVGYSKVIVHNLKRTDPLDGETEINTKTASGYAVTEFYTAKDFPVREYPTEVQHKQYAPPGIFIPFIGQQEFDNNGYSQGYAVELNDMHGKPKAVSSFAYNADYHDPDKAVTRTEYIYNTVSPYNPDATNRLLNLVTVLDGDADSRLALIGQQTEFFYDMDQHSSLAIQLGVQSNVDQVMVGAVVPTFIPSVNYNYSMFRSIVSMKVTTKTGILVETRTRNQSALAVQKHLMFDSHSGAPVLTSVTNDFDAPVYTYNFPAHWSYDAMDQAALNYGFKCGSVGAVSGGYYNFTSTFSDADLTTYFSIGDKVLLTVGASAPEYYWVNEFNPAGYGVQFIEEDGTVLSSGTINSIQVIKSGRSNQNVVNNGVIVSLQNPVTGTRDFPLFKELNTQLESGPGVPDHVEFEDCATGELQTVYVTVGTDYIEFSDAENCEEERCDCKAYIELDPYVIGLGVSDLTFHKYGKKVLIKYTSGISVGEYWGTWRDENHCYHECMDNVLHAEAYRFTDDWSYDYGDAGVDVGSSPLILNAANRFRSGTQGIWRLESSYAYQVNRKQEAPKTNIAVDGTYENFVFFHWDPANDHVSTNYDNPEWTFVSAQTKYNPYGFDIEARNALNIYSAALYGYDNSVSTAVAANATYYETAFDGFEDYGASYPSASPGHGHMTLTTSSGVADLKTDKSHTGKMSMDLTDQVNYANIPVVDADGSNGNIPDDPQTEFSVVAGKKYVVTAWVFSGASGAVPSLTVTGGVGVTTTIMPQRIEGWQRVETVFTAPSSGTVSIHWAYTGGNGSERLDDIRIQPFQSAMKTYVYDPVTLWLVASLDDRNFATYYNYDEEGKLVQVKSETERGIFTAKTSRDNIHH